MSREKPPAVVAELGRPETPEETAARKAQNSRNHRDRQTTRNLLYALIACLGLVALIVLIVPRSDTSIVPPVDYRAIAADAQPSLEATIIVPDVPADWVSNAAELRTGATDGVITWYIGFVTPSNDFVGMKQGLKANPSWLSTELKGSNATGTTDIDGLEWTVYDYREANDRGNLEYSLATTVDDTFFLVYGTADQTDAETLAAAITTQIGATE
ncbi:DUF4245 domain-containing protein [Amnibacterium flavum]|uniref:DUF4245 domain-containing protein n=1 Tax=Amnibacterium flavum TaxID=2173173 RepID=A0A2V1HMS4_9MICO|nr:DUF4245 domain-containing protein [Amnibacterium flavum]PVZ93721.1 DUF4245 domain-containing protein [Amnibacterium flavum]